MTEIEALLKEHFYSKLRYGSFITQLYAIYDEVRGYSLFSSLNHSAIIFTSKATGETSGIINVNLKVADEFKVVMSLEVTDTAADNTKIFTTIDSYCEAFSYLTSKSNLCWESSKVLVKELQETGCPVGEIGDKFTPYPENYEYVSEEVIKEFEKLSDKFTGIKIESKSTLNGYPQVRISIRDNICLDNHMQDISLREDCIIATLRGSHSFTYPKGYVNNIHPDDLDETINQIVDLAISPQVYSYGLDDYELDPLVDTKIVKCRLNDTLGLIYNIEDIADTTVDELGISDTVRVVGALCIPKLKVVDVLEDDTVILMSESTIHPRYSERKLQVTLHEGTIRLNLLDAETRDIVEELGEFNNLHPYMNKADYVELRESFKSFQML